MSNLPRRLSALYEISKIKKSELKEALQHEIFSRRTTAPQVLEILAEFRAKKKSPDRRIT